MTAPVVFVSHGAPNVALEDDDYTAALVRLGDRLAPKKILVVSAHWQTKDLRVGAGARPKLIYDFGGFADELYELDYAAPGDPELAARVAALTGATVDEVRGWDHGLWVPLRRMFPQARLPVVELSLPRRAPADLFALGESLQPLRDEGVLVLGSGGAVHNLGRVAFGTKAGAPAPWAEDFDNWLAARLSAGDHQAIVEWQTHAPAPRLAHPTSEHFDPLIVALGALAPGEKFETAYAGFHYGSLSMRTLVAGSPT